VAGVSFQFSVDGGAPITVVGGGCSAPLTTKAGTATVAELPAVGYKTSAIAVSPKANLISKNVKAGTVKAFVVAGSTPATETLVTYTNTASGGSTGNLKICKVAGDSSLAGDLFSFTENGGPAFSVAAGYPSANCSAVTSYQVGTVVNVAELATPGLYVSNITVSNSRGTNTNDPAGTVTATVGTGTTVVTYTNSIIPPAQTGWLEICKSAYDEYVNGYFNYTITAPGFSATQSVLTGQCSNPIQVPAGNVSVAETAVFPFTVEAIYAYQGPVVAENLTNGTVTVTVPVSASSSNEVLVDYVNQTTLGALKVCKTITANSGALTGSTFDFSVSASFDGEPIWAPDVSVVAGAPGTTACSSPLVLPLTSTVSVTEEGTTNVQNVGVSVSPASNDLGSAPPTANLTVGSGITTATFANEAFGNLKVCKVAADAETANQWFTFSVNGGPTFMVQAGHCSPVLAVPAGTATISESPSANFHLVSVSTNPSGDLKSVSGNTATVTVPFGGSSYQGNLVVASFTNAVNTGTFELCETTSNPAIIQAFTISWSYGLNGSTYSGTVSEAPGQCSPIVATVPVVDANGNPVTVSTSQTPGPPPIVIDSITLGGAGTLVTDSPSTGTASFNIGNGDSVLTYDTNIVLGA
jgi:hypothetical protein